MEQRLSIITLGVSDLVRAKQFYDALGWRAAEKDNANIVAYNLAAMSLVLYPKDKLAKDAGVAMNESGYSAFTLAYNVDSEVQVDAVLIQAEQAGAKIIKPATKAFWGGYSGYFSDPDHFLWEVAFNPFSPLGTSGEFQWGGAIQA